MYPMNKISPLSIAFIEQRPTAAARELENLRPDDAAALVEALPGRVSSLAVSAMTPLAAAHCLAVMDLEKAAQILRSMMFVEATSILRVIDDNHKIRILEALPDNLTRDFNKSLRHPTDSIGAWMDNRSSPLSQTHTVADALKHAKRKSRVAGDELFVLDETKKFAGVVRISELVRKDAKTLLKNIMESDLPVLSSRATLASAVNSPHWDTHKNLAVVGRKGNFLGTLSRSRIQAGLAAARRRPLDLTPNSVLTHLLTGVFVTFVGLLGLIIHSTDTKPTGSNGGRL